MSELDITFGRSSIEEADPEVIANFMRNFRTGFSESVREDRDRRAAFSTHMAEAAGPTVDHAWVLREMMREGLSWASVAVVEAVQRADDEAPDDAADHDRAYEWHRVMMGMAVHGLDVLGEVICLVEAGFPDGALARSRTLHELAVLALVLSKHGTAENRLVERFQAHRQAFTVKTSERLLATETPGISNTIDEDVLSSLREQAVSLEAEHGAMFMRPNGWAAPLFPGEKSISFEKLSKLVGPGLEFMYSAASQQVHAGSEAWNERIERLERDARWSIGPSPRNLDLPLELATHFAMVLVEVSIPTFIGSGRDRDQRGAAFLSAIGAVKKERPRIDASAGSSVPGGGER